MAKGEAKTNNRLLDENLAANRDFRNALMNNLGDAQTRSTDLFNNIVNRVNALGDSEARGGFQDFANTGGLDPALRAQAERDAGSYRTFANKKLSKSALNAIRGSGYYDELLKTGGLSDIDKYDIMSRAGSAARSTYENARDDLVRSQAGGSGVSTSLIDDIARKAAYANADVERDSRLGISDAVRTGRLTGAQGLSDAERYITDEADRRFLGGMQGASGITMGLADLVSRGRQFGLQGLAGLDSMGVDALTRLYGSAPGEVGMYNDLIGRSFGQDQAGIGQRMQYNPNKGFFDHLRDIGSVAAPIAGTLLSGGLFGGSGRNAAGQRFTDASQPWWGISG